MPSRTVAPTLTNEDILQGLYEASRRFRPGSKGGAHTEVLAFDADRLESVLRRFAAAAGVDVETRAAAIRAFAGDLAARFLMKIGHVDEFPMKLHEREETPFPRVYVSEAFGPIGYNLLPTWQKTLLDATEAVREIPYFAFGTPGDQFAPLLPETIRNFIASDCQQAERFDPNAVFLLNDGTGEKLTVYDILTRDRYFTRPIKGFDDLVHFQQRLREDPLDAAMVDGLMEFFNAPITVGVRDTVRWLLGSRHPRFNWDRARDLIYDCFQRHGHENYLLPETNVYAVDVRVPADRRAAIRARNERAVRRFAEALDDALPLDVDLVLDDAHVARLAEAALAYHHAYPEYELEAVAGVLSPTFLRFVGRFAMYFALFTAGIPVRMRRNVHFEHHFRTSGLEARLLGHLPPELRESFYEALYAEIARYVARGGVYDTDGTLCTYERLDTTSYCFAQIADYGLGEGERIGAKFSLEDLRTEEGRAMLDRYPEIGEKLVVFFVLVLRFYLDTDFIPDLRPEDAGRDLFLLGIWGYLTENVLVIISENEAGQSRVRIAFVDNKDHFKQYRREEDRDRPMGLAKHALRLIHPIVEPAIYRAIGNFLQIVHDHRFGPAPEPKTPEEHLDRAVEVGREVARKGWKEAQVAVEAVLLDSLDDAIGGVRRTLRRAAFWRG